MPSTSVYTPHFLLPGLAPIIEVAQRGVVAGFELFRRRAVLHFGHLRRQTRVGSGKGREERLAIGAFLSRLCHNRVHLFGVKFVKYSSGVKILCNVSDLLTLYVLTSF